MIKSNWTSLDMIKASSEQLFSFTELKTSCIILSIRPDAKYLFSNLQKITRTMVSITDLYDAESNVSNLKRFDEFKDASTEIERLCITHYWRDQHQIMTNIELVMQTLEGQKIKALEFDTSKLLDPFLQLCLHSKSVKSNIWSFLTDLRICGNKLDIDKWKLFDVFPKLEHLKLENNRISKISKSIFTNACNLVRLELKDNFEFMEKDSLRGLDSLKYLKINAQLPFHEFESRSEKECASNDNNYEDDYGGFECYHNDPGPTWNRLNRLAYPICFYFPWDLEELHLSNFAIKATNNPHAFVNLPPKLKVLILSKFSVESPLGLKTFDHLVELEQFHIRKSDIAKIDTSVAPKILHFLNCSTSIVKLKADANRISRIEEIIHVSEKGRLRYNELYLESMFNMTGLRKLTIEPKSYMQFHNMTNLQELYLKLNGMDFLQDGKFRCLANLKTLEISFPDNYYNGNFVKQFLNMVKSYL
jgi:Leucine-rich repeat (LRR) protein